MENENCNIGQRIYDLRIEHDIQQGELARAIHLHQSVLNRIERGLRPARDAEIHDIALHFGVSADYLLGLPATSTDTVPHLGPIVSDKQEIALIEKFRALDDRGKRAVMDTVDREYSYVEKDLTNQA